MKIKRRHDLKSEVATASLNDIMFFLLLFFLIVSTFANPHVIRLFLPKANSSQTIAKKQITLSITQKNYIISMTGPTISGSGIGTSPIKNNCPMSLSLCVPMAALTIQDLVDVLQMGSNQDIKMIWPRRKRRIVTGDW